MDILKTLMDYARALNANVTRTFSTIWNQFSHRFFVLRNKKRFLRFFSLQLLNKTSWYNLSSAHIEYLYGIFNSKDFNGKGTETKLSIVSTWHFSISLKSIEKREIINCSPPSETTQMCERKRLYLAFCHRFTPRGMSSRHSVRNAASSNPWSSNQVRWSAGLGKRERKGETVEERETGR